MLLRLAALATVLLAAACGPNHKKVCSASVSARAEGHYRDLPLQDATAVRRKHRYSCLSACRDGYDSPATAALGRAQPSCIEAELLEADSDPDKGIPVMITRCNDGRGWPIACAWIDDHAIAIAAWKARQADGGPTVPEAEPARPSMPPAEARAAVERAVAAISADAASNGLVLVSDNEYSLADGGETFELTMISDTYYTIHVVGSRATRFTARYGGSNFKRVDFPVRAVSDDTFVRASGLNDETTVIGEVPHLYILDDTGDRGSVRVLIFKRP